jgi:hypothetical protein
VRHPAAIARFIAALALLLSAPAGATDPVFTEFSSGSGLNSETYDSVSHHVHGLCWIDYDNDLYPDLLATNGNSLQTNLFHNNGDGTFTKVNELLPDLSNNAGEPAGCVFGDYDNDGDSDIYIQKASNQFSLGGENKFDGAPNLLLKNLWVENGEQILEGQALFTEVAATAEVDGMIDPPLGTTYDARRAMTGGWLDYDLDGCLDLYVGQMVLQEGGNVANKDTLYQSECDGTFADVSDLINNGTDTDLHRPALAFIAAHLDGDLWPDMFVINVHEPAPHFHDLMYINNANGTFSEVFESVPSLGDDAGSGMGVDVADIDLNGTWDIYITDNNSVPLGNVLYLGNGDGTFNDNSAIGAGVKSAFSWGTNFFDADHDGDEDLLIGVTNPVIPVFFLNDGLGGFTKLDAGIDSLLDTRGSAVADYDRDGDLDVVTIHDRGGKLRFFRNDSVGIGNWLQLKLIGVESNRDAINAMVVIDVGGQTQMRQIKGGSSAHSQDDLVVHFGVGAATEIDSVQVFWPHTNATVDEFLDVEVNQLLTVTEGETVVPCGLPENLTLESQDIDSVQLIEACNTITVGPALQVVSGGDLTLRAGLLVEFGDGSTVETGGTMVVEIDADIE